MFGISRGFRRLSVMAGAVGLLTLIYLLVSDSMNSNALIKWTCVVFLFAGAPAIFVLLLGWVVAGFRKPD